MPRLHIRPSGPLIRPSVQQTGIATHGSQSTATKAQRIPRATVISCGEGGVAELCGEAHPRAPGTSPPCRGARITSPGSRTLVQSLGAVADKHAVDGHGRLPDGPARHPIATSPHGRGSSAAHCVKMGACPVGVDGHRPGRRPCPSLRPGRGRCRIRRGR